MKNPDTTTISGGYFRATLPGEWLQVGPVERPEFVAFECTDQLCRLSASSKPYSGDTSNDARREHCQEILNVARQKALHEHNGEVSNGVSMIMPDKQTAEALFTWKDTSAPPQIHLYMLVCSEDTLVEIELVIPANDDSKLEVALALKRTISL